MSLFWISNYIIKKWLSHFKIFFTQRLFFCYCARENLFNDYFKNIIPEILPNGIVLKTVDTISDDNGVAIIQEGDAVGKNGEYDNKYVWVFKMKDGLIHSIREYNSDILVATQLYDYKLINTEEGNQYTYFYLRLF